MKNPMAGESDSGALNINQLQDVAMNFVENICSIICRPVEIILRPWHGTRYFPPPIIFFSSVVMILLPAIAAAFNQLSPLALLARMRVPAPQGFYGLGSLSELYFLLSFLHGIRLYRRMFDMSLETNSHFEGPPLFFFGLLPKGQSFWFTRIVWEPLFVLVTALILGRMFIFQSSLVSYLEVTSLALAMKGFIGWYRGWEYMRTILDMRYTEPIIARLSDDQASDEELATIHLASFPKNLPHDIRQAAVEHIARTVTPGSTTPSTQSTQGESHADHH